MPLRGRAKEAAEEAAAELAERSAPEYAPIAPIAAMATPMAPPMPQRSRAIAPPAEETMAIHERADADLRTTTVAPKNVSGFKLPPSTLLTQGEEPLAIREDMLREEARKLVEKCGEFKVNGQVVQINPGPMVTTYEFKPDASVK